MTTKRNLEKLGFSIDEASEATGLSKPFLRGEIKNGKLKVTRFGRRVLILANDFSEYLAGGSKGKQEWTR